MSNHGEPLVVGLDLRRDQSYQGLSASLPAIRTRRPHTPCHYLVEITSVGSPTNAVVRFRKGRVQNVEVNALSDFVSERGNPGNNRGVDTVLVTAPSPHLPVGTEVVETPGTGSVHRANTKEAARARDCVDLAVLVVSADPPVSATELDLANDVMATAAAAAVVVNKTDLIATSDVGQIVEYTRAAVQDPCGAGVPVLPMSLRTDTPTALVKWLDERIIEHGEQDILTSTARALRREVSSARDRLWVERDLLDRSHQDRANTVASLRQILDHARTAKTARLTTSVDGHEGSEPG